MLPFSSPGNLPDPGIEPWSLVLQADSLPFEPPGNKLIKMNFQRNFFVHFMKVKVVHLCPTLWDLMDYSPWNFPAQNTGVGTFPFARESSQPRDRTQVSCIAGGFFTSWATYMLPNCAPVYIVLTCTPSALYECIFFTALIAWDIIILFNPCQPYKCCK